MVVAFVRGVGGYVLVVKTRGPFFFVDDPKRSSVSLLRPPAAFAAPAPPGLSRSLPLSLALSLLSSVSLPLLSLPLPHSLSCSFPSCSALFPPCGSVSSIRLLPRPTSVSIQRFNRHRHRSLAESAASTPMTTLLLRTQLSRPPPSFTSVA